MIEEIAPGILIERALEGANVGAIVSEEGVVFVDTPRIPSQVRVWLQEVREYVGEGLPFLYVINTDHHKGHCLGNKYFGVPVIAHEIAWKHMRGYKENFKQRLINSYKKKRPEVAKEFEDWEVQTPEITFKRKMSIVKGDKVIRLIHVGGHTPATILVYLPQQKVLFAGDCVLAEQHPYMAQADSKAWLEALTAIRRLGDEVKIVPGHGPVTNRKATEEISEYIRALRSKVRQCYRNGLTKQETAVALAKEFIAWFPIPPERRSKIESQVKQGIRRVYREMEMYENSRKGEEAGEQEE